MNKKKIAVLFGGHSTEYEVALKSAASVFEHIDWTKFEVFPIGITMTGDWYHYTGDPSRIPEGTWCQDAAIRLAFQNDSEVIAEEAIEGFEVGCAILIDTAENSSLLAPNVAALSGSISNELLCRLGSRLPVVAASDDTSF